MDLNLKNKQYIITGSSRGIGLGIAKVLLEEGARVMITGRNSDSIASAFELLNSKFPGNVLAFTGDFTEANIAGLALEKIISEWGSIDGVVANAGAVKPVPDWNIDGDDWEWFFTNNLNISVHIVTKSISYLQKTKGAIVFIGSIAGIEEIGAPLPYSASKAALTMYAKSLSRKLALYNIRVNTIAPGNVLFPDGNWDKKRKTDLEAINRMLETKVPLKKFGTPEDIGSMAAFLLSEKASFVTGSCFVIDGGQTSSFN